MDTRLPSEAVHCVTLDGCFEKNTIQHCGRGTCQDLLALTIQSQPELVAVPAIEAKESSIAVNENGPTGGEPQATEE
jgi:hypothetical protein